jgi:hypothetical protein
MPGTTASALIFFQNGQILGSDEAQKAKLSSHLYWASIGHPGYKKKIWLPFMI